MRRIPCPLCQSTEYKTISRFAGPWNFRVRNVICTRCGFVYRNPQWDKQEAVEFYSKVSRYYARVYSNVRLQEGNPRERQRAERRLRWVLEHVSPPARILDVGARSGAFVAACIAKGFDTVGIELDEEAVAMARSRSIPLSRQDFEDTAWQPEAFDAITMFHVLEHALDLRSFLQRTRGLLRPHGLVFVEVPDLMNIRIPLKDFLVPEHSFHFTAKTLQAALQATGFSVEECYSEDVGEGYANMLFAVATPDGGAGTDRPEKLPLLNSHYQEVMAYLTSLPPVPPSAKRMAREALTRVFGPWLGQRAFLMLASLRRALLRPIRVLRHQ